MMENSINERVKNIVESLNMTANAFAQELNVAGSVVYNIIKGRNKPSFDILDKIVSLFNVSPTYLLIGEGDIFMSNDESTQIDIQRTGDTVEDYGRFLKQWDRIKSIVKIKGKEKSHDYYEAQSLTLTGMANILEHYSLMTQSITFLRFAPEKIANNILVSQIMNMLKFEEELSNIIKPHENILIQLSNEIDAFNKRHDNHDYFDDEYYENLMKKVDEEMNPPLS